MTARLTLAWAAGATTGLAVGILAGVTVRDAVALTRLRRPEPRSGVGTGTTATPVLIGPQTGTQQCTPPIPTTSEDT